jgi:hypothetical protein
MGDSLSFEFREKNNLGQDFWAFHHFPGYSSHAGKGENQGKNFGQLLGISYIRKVGKLARTGGADVAKTGKREKGRGKSCHDTGLSGYRPA